MNTMIACADALHLPLADKSVDLVFGSPPYCDARDYGIGADRDCDEWIDWMLEVTVEALRVARNCVVWVAAGVTRDRNYWPACEGLMFRWWRDGRSMYRPCYWHRVGIPGSGGNEKTNNKWFRADVEYVMCFKRPGALEYCDNTAMGHTPKYSTNGECSHRLSNGQRVNQWGPIGSGRGRRKDGSRKPSGSPSHRIHTKRTQNGQMQEQAYVMSVRANPGNLINTKVGGGHLGSTIAHENEAPFPEKLAEFFVLSLCRPGGTVLDPFSGSGTTAAVAQRYGRRAIAMDLRLNQCALTRRRVTQDNQPSLFSQVNP